MYVLDKKLKLIKILPRKWNKVFFGKLHINANKTTNDLDIIKDLINDYGIVRFFTSRR